MARSLVLARSPMLLTLFPYGISGQDYDKPVNAQSTKPPLVDEYGWDRVKQIFQQTEHRTFTKEFHSIMHTTLTGFLGGMCISGMLVTKKTVNDFVASNEATRFPSQFDAKKALQQRVFENFLKTGFKIGGKLGLFCCIFSSVTTSTTAYRGKLTVGNYIFGGLVTGLLFRLNMGIRGGLVGAGVGSVLGGLGGCVTVLGCKLTGVSIDQLLIAQEEWRESTDEMVREKVRKHINKEASEVKQLYDENQRLRLPQEKEGV